MVVLTLTKEQAHVLHTTLVEALDEIRVEIVRTEAWELRDGLKTNERHLEEMMAMLEKASRKRASA